MTRSITLLLHPSRPEAHDWAKKIVKDLNARNIEVRTASEVAIEGATKKSEQEIKKSVTDCASRWRLVSSRLPHVALRLSRQRSLNRGLALFEL